jgi:hypothetical protein
MARKKKRNGSKLSQLVIKVCDNCLRKISIGKNVSKCPYCFETLEIVKLSTIKKQKGV